jgi:multidrug transporter EmrE-like cation transporter
MESAPMTRDVFTLIVVSVLMSALAQIALKGGMSSASVSHALASGDRWTAAATIATSPLVLLGLGLYFASALVWLLVLARIEVSLAYPFVGMGFVVTMLLGWWIHGDSLTAPKVAGTLLVALGVIVLARG